MNRRSFLRALLASPLAATLDLEQLLWVPKSLITVPAPPFFEPKYYSVSVPITLDEINLTAMKQIYPRVLDEFFKVDPFLKLMRDLPPQPRPSWERAL